MKFKPQTQSSQRLWIGTRVSRAVMVSVSLAIAGCAAAPPPTPVAQVGVVDFQKVFTETEAGKKARESLNTFMKNRQALIELEKKELEKMRDDFAKQASVLSANAKKDREEQFQQRAMQFQQKVSEMNREVQEKQQEVLEGFREKIEKVVAKVAQKQGLTVVIEKGRGGPTLYNDASLDISARVIEEFNKGGL